MPLAEADLEPLLRLSLVQGVGPRRMRLLVEHYGTAERALSAAPRELAMLPGLGPAVAEAIARASRSSAAAATRRAMAGVRRARAVGLTPDDPLYPDAFRTVHEPPFLLFAAGSLELLRRSSVAMVGTRSPTPYGRATTEELASGLAARGYAVVSGMARGIDSVAHTAALDRGGMTIGVLGHGIDVVYPPESRRLFDRVRERGLLLSEFSPGESPRAGNFPRRNRLIAALSAGVVVVEMSLRSGAQHTVNFALDLGREVMAVPGPVGSPQSEGTNRLIREGARPVTNVEEVVEELEGVGQAVSPSPLAAAREAPPLPLLDPRQAAVLAALGREPRHVDTIARETGSATGALLSALLDLELLGMAEALPGMHFRRR